jgi:processive 1,2-diacylglycerol beta-glucosyltransferase
VDLLACRGKSLGPLHARAAKGKLCGMETQPESMDGPKILIASASVGAGHNQAAKAIAETLRLTVPEASIDLIDTLTFAPWCFRAYYAQGYVTMVTRFPRLYGLGFWLNDHPRGSRRGLRERLRLLKERPFLRRFAEHVRQTKPDLVINTHFLAPPLIAHMIRRGQYAGRQIVVVTDVLMHRFWLSENVEHWFVPAEPPAERLRKWGIAPDRITVSGMPIHPKWTQTPDRRKTLAEWNLPEDRPIVLLAGGAEFTCGPVVRIAREIVARRGEAFVAVLAGRNKDLLAQIAQTPEAGRSIIGIPFTDRVHELVAVCALMATKAGGLSTAECLAKGTPMVLLRPVPGQEAGNAEYFARHGAAVIARKDNEVAGIVARLLADPDELARMAAAARELYRPGAQTIADAVRKTLGR